MSRESLAANVATEENISHNVAETSRKRRLKAGIAAAGLVAAVAGGISYLDRDSAPCASTTSLDGTFTSAQKMLVLPNGSTVDFTIFSKSSDLNTKHPHAMVEADGTSHLIESLNGSAPAAEFTFGGNRLLVYATNSTITTYCVPVAAAK